jgi:pantoate ligase / CMP/dCMP kinase
MDWSITIICQDNIHVRQMGAQVGVKSSVDTQVFETIDQYRTWRSGIEASKKVGLVPTMGALHEGHLTLMQTARRQCDHVVVSIFVNPLQFGPNEDFDKYPRSFPADLELCRRAGVDAIFHPSVSEFYPLGLAETTRVIPPAELINRLCGNFRPGHFEGVTTVVLKLFAVAQPTLAYFGEKDYQQLTVIRRMVADLNLPVEVIPVPTVREADGLALSSRNVYLSVEQRQLAPILNETLREIREAIGSGQPVETVLSKGRDKLSATAGIDLQYLEVVDPLTLAPLTGKQQKFVVLVAAKLGTVRLIDNVISA